MIKFFVLFALFGFTQEEFNYDVEWTTYSSETDYHTLTITIENCKTTFKIKSKDLKKFSENKFSHDQAIKIAVERAKLGCQK